MTALHNAQLMDMTALHNAQLMDMTALHNAQLKAMTEHHDAQLVAQAEECNARLAEQAARYDANSSNGLPRPGRCGAEVRRNPEARTRSLIGPVVADERNLSPQRTRPAAALRGAIEPGCSAARPLSVSGRPRARGPVAMASWYGDDGCSFRRELILPWHGRRSHTSTKRQRVSRSGGPGNSFAGARACIGFVRLFVAGVILMPCQSGTARFN